MIESRGLEGRVQESECDLKEGERSELSRVRVAWQPCVCVWGGGGFL